MIRFMQKKPLLQRFRDLSFTWKIWLVFLLIFLVSITLLTWVSNNLSSQVIINQIMEVAKRDIQEVSGRLDTIFESMNSITKMAITDDRLQSMLTKSYEYDPLSIYGRSQKMRLILNIFTEPRTLLDAMLVYGMNGETYACGTLNSYDDLSDTDFLRLTAALTQDNLSIWSDIEPSDYKNDNQTSLTLSLYKKVYSGWSGEELGIIRSTISERKLSELYENVTIGKTGSVYLVNREGVIVSHPDRSQIFTDIAQSAIFTTVKEHHEGSSTMMIEGVNSLLVYSHYPLCDWYIIGITPVSEILVTAQRVTFQLFLLCIIAILTTTIFSFILSRTITRPIRELKKTMKQAGKGDLSVRAKHFSHDEIGILSQEFNVMLDRINSLIDKSIQEQKLIRKHELALLQSQLNPHFLNNALENTCGLIGLDRKDDSIDLICDIARFYRTVLAQGDTIVTIAQELENVELYVNILNVQHQGKINFSLNIDDSILDSAIIKLTLQPLIENAIYHGLKEKRGDWKLTLSGAKENGDIALVLSDNGKGMTQEKIESLFKSPPSTKGLHRKSIGIRATHERLIIEFGSAYGLQYESIVGRGTTVKVLIPKIKKESIQVSDDE